ncbi:heme-binding protein 2-like [Gouania willdenowi]|uniref:Heme-binding protein 1 n=1 Tax=Gouania willdenowi TaxID=441366 RepID=A0A8C5H9X4_GOUWI|nr:heme-binding protein 2-like [Gouania willdenowi]
MMYLSGVICFLLILTVEARVGNSSYFCHETEECLYFDRICGNEDYEVRRYDSVQWVSTDEECYFMEFAAWKAFHRLHDYIKGENEEGIKMEMTSPVVIQVMKTSFWRPNKYTISFLLPSEYQEYPPEPTQTDPLVYIQRTPEMYVYVKSYGGWATTIMDKIKSYFLSCDLDKQHADYVETIHYSACYNSPMTILNRHNEVWMEALGNPACGHEEMSFY